MPRGGAQRRFAARRPRRAARSHGFLLPALALLGAFREGACARGPADEPSQEELADFFRRVSARFRRAREETAGDSYGSGLLEASGAQDLTIGIIATPAVDSYANASTANWREYASLHGYGLRLVRQGIEEACGDALAKQLEAATGHFAPIWGKVCLLRSLLQQTPISGDAQPSYVLVMDADTFVQRPEFDAMDVLVRGLLEPDRRASGLMFDDRSAPADYPGCWGHAPGGGGLCLPNTFLLLFRRGPEARAFAQRWLDDALGRCADDAGSFPPTQRVLWRCTLPETERAHPGLIHVTNGMDKVYTMDIRQEDYPLVHFESEKHRNLVGVRRAIARVQPQFRQAKEVLLVPSGPKE